ncbi:MAG TPA: DUF1223 domain-containing protein [Terriglobales bacterium]|jgi:hypothetical protein|nr:DUF1223 domain-containing protein [Terriglobales bacterium]
MNRVLAVALCLLWSSIFVELRGTQSGAVTVPENSDAPASGILVELFTSEGCSSCPPADELLRKLDAQRTIANSQIVVLGEHVDYWDRTGWRDRFSSRDYTDRQQEYAVRLGVPEPYTPQMVVDGKQEFVGNNPGSLEAALRTAANAPKTSLSILAADIDGNNLLLKLKTTSLPPDHKRGDLYVAVADNSDETQVHGGENSGRALRHVAVLRSLQKVAKVGPEGLTKDVTLRLPKDVEKNNLRVVAFVQESGNGRVLGSTVRILSRTTATR